MKTRRDVGGILGAAAQGAVGGIGGGPVGMGVGAVFGVASKLLGDAKAEKEAAQARARQQRFADSAQYIADMNDAIAFNNQFNEAAFGMDLSAATNPNQPLQGLGMEVNPSRIASDVMRVNGPGHANGGVDVDVNLDGVAEVEVEGGEVIKNDAVFSKRLKVPNDFVDRAKEFGFSFKRDSYAKIAEKLASYKKDYEEKMDTLDVPTINTSLAMLDRVEILYQDLFATQEFSKLSKERF